MLLSERFYHFVSLIDGIHKSIQKLRVDFAPELGIKSVHLFWIYELYVHPKGLTSAELAAENNVSRSLVSRELELLQKDGYVDVRENARGKRKNYNSRITLTQKGLDVAHCILLGGLKVQNEVSEGLSDEELATFYTTLERLHDNLRLAAKKDED